MDAITNLKFIRVVFGNAPDGAVPWVAGFSVDPYNAGGAWHGGPVLNGKLPRFVKPGHNTFFAISTFCKGKDGEYHRRKENFAACHLIMVDDVGTKVERYRLELEPSYLLETSPGNYQAGYLLAEKATDGVLIERVLDAMVAQGLALDGKDPGMKGVTRYGRLPVGWNTKQKYIDRLGAPFVHQLEEWHPERRYSLQDIIEAFEIDLDRGHTRGGTRVETDDPILKALEARGLIKGPVNGKAGVWDVTCPWVEEHTDRADSGAAYFQPHFDGRDKPGYRCHHGHCENRTIKDVLAFLKPAQANDSGLIKPYTVSKGAIYWLKRIKDGCVPVPLCDFTAAIKECIHWDDGAETTAHLVIQGETWDGRRLPAVEVPSSAFPSLNWITTNWTTDAFVFAGQAIRDHLRAAIQALSEGINKRTVYGHLGWRKIEDRWYFLHAGGGIGATDRADIEVRPDKPRMRLYHLGGHSGHSFSKTYIVPKVGPPPEHAHVHAENLDPYSEKKVSRVSTSSKSSNGAVSGQREEGRWTLGVSSCECPPKSLRLLDLSKSKSVGYVLLSSAYRAPLAEAYRIDLSLFLFGKTGQRKSELTCMPLAHFGAGFDTRSFPAGWADTETDLEVASFRAKDVVFVIDDFKPIGSADGKRLQSKADRILHAGVGNQSGRGRRRANLGAMPTYYPRGMVLSSGEDIPKTRSLRGRAVLVPIETGSVDLSALSEAQKMARDGEFCADMADYIRWLAPQMDGLKRSLREEVIKYRSAYMNTAKSRGHERAPENFGQLFTGLVYFLRWAFETGKLTEENHDLHLAEGGRALAELLGLQAEYQRDADEAVKFINLLRAALLSGRCHLAGIQTGDVPQNHDRFGWRREQRGDYLVDVPLGARVGHTDGTDLFLDQEAVFAVVQRMARDQDEVFAITQRTLWQHLYEAGFLAAVDRRTDGKVRTQVRKSICGVMTDVMHLSGHSLLDTSSVQLAAGDPLGPVNGASSGQVDTLDTYFPYIGPKVLSDASDGERDTYSLPTRAQEVYEAITRLNGRPVDGLRLAEFMGRSLESIEPTLDELARRGLIRPRGVSWLTSPVILQGVGGEP